MAGGNNGYTDPIERFKQTHDFPGQLRVQVPGGFVRNQEPGPGDNRPGDAYPLLFAAGENGGVGPLPTQQTNLIQGRPGSTLYVPRVEARYLQGQRDVVQHRTVVQQLVVLEDNAELATIAAHVPPLDPGGIAAIDPQGAH